MHLQRIVLVLERVLRAIIRGRLKVLALALMKVELDGFKSQVVSRHVPCAPDRRPQVHVICFGKSKLERHTIDGFQVFIRKTTILIVKRIVADRSVNAILRYIDW